MPAGYNLYDHPFPAGRQTITHLYSIPNQPEWLLRREGLAAREFPDEAAVIDLLALGVQHHQMLAKLDLHIPSHRHLFAELPDYVTEREGRVITLLRRFHDLTPLEPKNPEHVAATVHVIANVALYGAQVVEDNPPGVMWDVFRLQGQYSLQQVTPEEDQIAPPWADAPQGVLLHDFGLAFAPVWTDGQTSYRFNRSLCWLTKAAESAARCAQGTPHEDQANAALSLIRTELPPADFQRKG